MNRTTEKLIEMTRRGFEETNTPKVRKFKSPRQPLVKAAFDYASDIFYDDLRQPREFVCECVEEMLKQEIVNLDSPVRLPRLRWIVAAAVNRAWREQSFAHTCRQQGKPVKPSANLFDGVLGPLSGQTDSVFPIGNVSLIAGGSGSGKSTWAYDLLEHQQNGASFIGRETHKRPFHVLMHDRSERSLQRTFARMGINENTFPYSVEFPRFDKKRNLACPQCHAVLNAAEYLLAFDAVLSDLDAFRKGQL